MAKLRLYVLCSSEAARQEWRGRAACYPDLEIEPLLVAGSHWRALLEIVREPTPRPVLVCREDVWFGKGFGAAVEGLLAELDRDWPGWSICGNRGAAWDGRVVDYTRDRNLAGLQTGVGVRSVLTLDDDLLLVNPAAFSGHDSVEIPEPKGQAFGLVASLSSILNGSAPLADRRLMAIRTDPEAARRQADFVNGAAFRDYWRARFVNHRLPTADQVFDLAGAVDYRALDPRAGQSRSDLVALCDRALCRTRARRPTLAICCRTQFKRPRLLRRALTSIVASALAARAFVDSEIVLVTDAGEGAADEFQRDFGAVFPDAGVRCIHHRVRPGRHSRADLLLAGIEQAQTDYVWFVDDDDFLLPGAVTAAARAMLPGQPVLLVGNTVAWNEPPGEEAPGSFRSRFHAEDVFKVFAGVNRVPVCGMILPVRLAQQRLRERGALGDYSEDYFVLLALMTAPRIEILTLDADLCGISFRGQESTAAETDLSRWYLSDSTVLLELLSSDDTNNPLLWQLSQRIP